MTIYKKMACGLFLVFFLQGIVNAQDVKMYRDKTPTAEEMGEVLFSSQPPSMESDSIKMRSISFEKAPIEKAQAQAVGLPIKFAYNSAEVLEESKPFLNEVGRMLSLSNFANEKLLIEGHTDAIGSKTYNLALSERRAQSVKNYLKENFNISSNRLFVDGVGESMPLAGEAPGAAVNRRVQFRKAP